MVKGRRTKDLRPRGRKETTAPRGTSEKDANSADIYRETAAKPRSEEAEIDKESGLYLSSGWCRYREENPPLKTR